MKIPFLYSVILVGFLCSCDQGSEKDEISNNTMPANEKIDTTSQVVTETNIKPESKTKVKTGYQLEQNVTLKKFDTISFGSGYQSLKTAFPTLKDPKPENDNPELGKKGLKETTGEVYISGIPANIKFLLKNDSLYTYSINLTQENFDKAEELNDALLEFYTQKYGDYQTEKVEEENRFFRTIYWFQKDRTLVMNYNINSGSFLWFYKKNERNKGQ